MMDLFSKECIFLDEGTNSKEHLLDLLVTSLHEAGHVLHKDDYLKDIIKRELVSGTGLEYGIALPHARSEVVKEYKIAVLREKETCYCFSSVDKIDSKLFFMLAIPENTPYSFHLKVLSTLGKVFKNTTLRDSLMTVKDTDEFLKIFRNVSI